VTTVSAPVAGRSLASRHSPSSHSPFFIFGCPRSGTSLLSTMLGTHPNLAIPQESHLYDNIFPIVQRHGDLSRAETRALVVSEMLATGFIKNWNPAPTLPETLDAIRRPGFHGLVDALLRAWASKQGKPRWGEKTPQHTLCWRSILEGFHDVQVIHVVRDGRDVMLSYRSAFFGPKHVYPLAVRWQQYLDAAEEVRACLGEGGFLQVRYEDLVAAPEAELRRICSFLGEDFTPAMLAFHKEDRGPRRESRNAQNLRRPVLSDNTEKWRTQMTQRELRIFEALAGPYLIRYGYQTAVQGASVSRWESLSCRYLEHPPKRLSSVLRNTQAHRLVLEKLKLRLLLQISSPAGSEPRLPNLL
jgi:Sulfotransferase family